MFGNRLYLYLSLAIIFTSAAAWGGGNPFLVRDRYDTASYLQGPSSPLLNPALGGKPGASYFGYMADAYDSGDRVNHLVVLNAWGFTLSHEWLREAWDRGEDVPIRPGARLFSAGKGIMFGEVFGLGVAYSYAMSDEYAYNHYRSLEYGLLFQPTRFFSFGYVMKDANRPRVAGERVPVTEIYSLSLRPFHEYLTLSCDAEKTRSERFGGSDIRISAELLLGGGSLFARWLAEGSFAFGVMIPLSLQAGGSSTLIAGAERSLKSARSPARSRVSVALSGEADRGAPALLRSILKIDITSALNEIPESRLFQESPLSFHEVLGAIRDAAGDSGIESIFMKIGANDLGFAQVQEMRDEIKRFRATGKRVDAVLTVVENKTYYLASAADSVSLAPSEAFSLTGLSAQVYFFRGALEKIGVKVESVRHGKYKSFNEPFTRDRMSDEYRENLMALLVDLNVQFLHDIISDRTLSQDRMDELFAKGFMTPEEAKRAGFIDGILYPDEALDDLKDRGLVRGSMLECADYSRSTARTHRWGVVPAVAVVHVNGSIVQGGDGEGGFTGDSMSDELYSEIIEKIYSDQSIKAVVIRVDSGGGSAAASDLMWHALRTAKKRSDKPVVFSFGNVAASGGYYIACTGDRIFSMPGSVTGSIGVISGKLSLEKLYGMLGISKEVLKMSEFADIYSESRDLTAREREILQRGVDFIYDTFTGKVASARQIAQKDIPSVAEGRVFTGAQAKDKALVDELGGLMAAIEAARGSANIEGECRVLHFPHGESQLVRLLGTASAPEGRLARVLKPVTGKLKGFYFGSDPYLYALPCRLDIK